MLKTDNFFFALHSKKNMSETKLKMSLQKQFNIYFIELPKLNITDCSDISELELWVKFLNAKSKEDLDMIEKKLIILLSMKQFQSCVITMMMREQESLLSKGKEQLPTTTTVLKKA